MRPFKIILLILGFFLILGISCRAEQTWEYSMLQRAVSVYTARAQQYGSVELRSALNQVEIVIEESPIINAWYARAPGGANRMGRVTLTTGYYLQLTYLAELNILSAKKPELTNAHQAYLNYLYEYNISTQSRRLKDLPLAPLKAPEDYARVSGACASLAAEYPFPPGLKPMRGDNVYAALTFAITHEIGHHWLGHNGLVDETFKRGRSEKERKEIFFSEMRRSRDQELAADKWATRQLMVAGGHPFNIISVEAMQTLIASSGLDSIFEKTVTHPTALHRIDVIIDEILRCDKDIYKRSEPPKQVGDMLTSLQAFAQKAYRLLPPAPEP